MELLRGSGCKLRKYDSVVVNKLIMPAIFKLIKNNLKNCNDLAYRGI